MQLRYVSVDNTEQWELCRNESEAILIQFFHSFLLLHSKPLRPATVCILALPVGMYALMTSTPTGSQGLMISTCLGSLGCHNLEFVMPYVSDLFGCCSFTRRDRPVSKGKETKLTPLYNILAHSIWFSSRPMEISSSVTVHFGASEFKAGEVWRGMHGTDALMWSCFTLCTQTCILCCFHTAAAAAAAEIFLLAQPLRDKPQTLRITVWCLVVWISELVSLWVHFVHVYGPCKQAV